MLSISSPIPGMLEGKPAGTRCIHLTDKLECRIFNSPDRPKVCDRFKPETEFCGTCREEALQIFARLEEFDQRLNKKPGSN